MKHYNFKDIHIGEIIQTLIAESNIENDSILKFHNFSQQELDNVLIRESIDAEHLLKWSKLLGYDFFRLYSQHLILYSPPTNNKIDTNYQKNAKVLRFRKNIYTKEIIDFLVEIVISGKKTHNQVIEEYKIPKTTLYKWIDKYSPVKDGDPQKE